MKKLVHALALSGLATVSTLAAAADSPHTITGNVGIYSQYVFRGLSQSDEEPALQGGFDYSHASGLYAGVWGSSISWLKDFGIYDEGGSLELDIYGGYRGTIGEVGYDVGLLQYWYPGDTAPGMVDADTTEIYAGVSWKWLGAKLSYSLGDTFGVDDADGTYYLDLYANVPVTEKLVLGLHYGKQEFDGPADDDASYDDWKISLTYDMGNSFYVGAAYTDTNAEESFYTAANGTFVGDSQFYVWLQKTF